MLLVADIGNTNVRLGLYEGPALRFSGKLPVERVRDMDREWAELVEPWPGTKVTAAAISSVHPKVRIPFTEWLERALGVRPRVVGETLPIDMRVAVDDPAAVGADRIVGAYAAWRELGKGPIVVVDAGTAVTVNAVSEKGEYMGGAIAPGLSTAARSLAQGTALLPLVEVGKAERAIGRNTVDAIRSGLYFGFAGLVDALCSEVARELGKVPRFLSTGGDAALLSERSRFPVALRPNLKLDGLRLAFEAASA